MTNILFIADYAAPYKGNFVPALLALDKHLRAQGGQAVYVFPELAQQQAWAQALEQEHTVYYIDRSFFSKRVQISTLWKLRSICRCHKIGVVHTHFVAGNVNLLLLHRLTRLPFVGHLHNHYIVSGRLGFLRKYFFCHTNGRVIGDSESVSQSAYALGIAPERVLTAPNAIDFTRLDGEQVASLRVGEQAVVLMFGYPWYRKGVDIAVRAVAQLRATQPVRLCIAQSGQVEQTRQGIASTLGECPDWVTFLPPTEHLEQYYNGADVFLSAGREEGLSYSPIEAAYCACGVACSRIGGNPLDIPLIEIYPTEQVSALAEALQRQLALTPSQRTVRNEQQRTYVKQHYNIDDWAQRILLFYPS